MEMRGGRTKKLDRFASKRPDELAFTERSSLLSDLNAPSRFRSGKLNQHERDGYRSAAPPTPTPTSTSTPTKQRGESCFGPRESPNPTFFGARCRRRRRKKKNGRVDVGFADPG